MRANPDDIPFFDDLVRFYEQSPLGLQAGGDKIMPGADIFCSGATGTAKRLAALVNVLCKMKRPDKTFPFSGIVVVYPLVSADTLATLTDRLHATAVAVMTRLHGNEAGMDFKDFLYHVLRVMTCPTLDVNAASDLLEAIEPGSAVIFVDAAKYRKMGLSLERDDGEATVAIEEDLWVRHLRAFAEGCVASARAREVYVVLDAGQHSPYKAENQKILESVSGCGVLGSKIIGDSRGTLVSKIDDWARGIESGLIGRVFSEIDSLPDSLEHEKRFIKIQLLGRAKLAAQTLELLRQEVPMIPEDDPSVLVRYARFAQDGGDTELCVKFLSAALPSVVAPEDLELAWSVCSDIDNTVFEEMCLRRLKQVLPTSHRIEQNRFRNLIDAGRYAEASQLLENPIPGYSSEFVEFHKELLPRLVSTPEPDYDSILRLVGLRWNSLLERGRLICAADARRRNVPHEALRILLSEQAQEPVSERIGMSILRSLEEVFLQLPGGGTPPDDHDDLLRNAVLKLVHYSALHPAETTVRNGLSNVLSPAISGMTGLFVVATVALGLSSSQTMARSGRLRHDRPSVELAELPRLLEPVLDWMSREAPVVIGRCVMPKELLKVPADELVPPLERLLHGEASKLIDEGDLKTFEHILYPGVLAARHSSQVGDDLILLRLAASKLALAGRSQKARDVTEQCLQLAGEDVSRSRLAWFAYADIYERLHNPLEALIGMACTFACQAEVTAEQAWYEIYLLIRVFRDLHMTELAKPLLPRGQALVQELGPDGEYQHRFVTLELGLRLFELNPNLDGGTADIEEFLRSTERLCGAVLKRSDDIVPAATLLAQGIYFCHLRGFAVPESVSVTLESVLAKIDEPLRETIRALTTKAPSAQQVLSLVRRVEPARYASDTGFDLQYAVIGGRRLLDSPEALQKPEQIAFAIELLADQGLQRHAGATPTEDALHGLPISIEEPRKLLEEFSRSGITVTMMGVSAAGRVTSVTAKDGVLGPVLSNNSATFSEARLAEWAKRFPYGYGEVSPTDNTFYTSMHSLGINMEEPRPTLLIVDTALAQIPANLLLIRDEFVGRTTAVAAAPSLAWLRSATSQPRCSTGRRVAWISTSGDGSNLTALSMLSMLLTPTLERHGFEVKTESEIPKELRGAEIAIVAAHGGLVSGGHYFSVVADEEDLRITSGALAGSLRSAELAILFVCSGGRFDKHPFANTTVGLARDLLDRGCRAVIASPWPLDSGVPPHWLPRFLELWDAGASAMEANFQANKVVEQALGDAPARCLAMAVFGDPLLKKLP